MPLMLLAVMAFCWLVSGRRMLRVRRVPAWRSATMGVDGLDSYTAFGYANPTRRVLAGLLHTRSGASDVVEVVEAYLYRPALRSLLAVAAVARRLQSGRLDAYLLYMLITLIALIAVVTALA